MSGTLATVRRLEGWRARFLLVLAGVFIAGAGAGLARPALAYYLRYDLGATIVATASLTSSFMLGRTLGSALAGISGARSPGRAPALVAGALLGVALLLSYMSGLESVRLIVALMSLWGLFAGLAWPTVQVGVSWLLPGRGATLLSIYFSIGVLGISAGNMLFGWLQVTYPEMVRLGAFLIALSIPPLAASLAGVRPQDSPGSPRRVDRTSGVGVWLPLVYWILAVALFMGVLSGMLREFFYVYAREVLGLEREELGGLLALSGVVAMLVSIPAGAAADRFGVWSVLPLLVLLGSLGAALFALPGLGAMGYVLAAVAVRSSLPQTRNAQILPGARGAALVGASNSASSIGMMLGPVVAGYVYESLGLPPEAPYVVAGVALAVLGLAGLLLWRLIIRGGRGLYSSTTT